MTVIAVAHRLATIQKADVIFVFGESEVGRGSRVVEQGTHHDLLRRRGAYWQMVSNRFHFSALLTCGDSVKNRHLIGKWMQRLYFYDRSSALCTYHSRLNRSFVQRTARQCDKFKVYCDFYLISW